MTDTRKNHEKQPRVNGRFVKKNATTTTMKRPDATTRPGHTKKIQAATKKQTVVQKVADQLKNKKVDVLTNHICLVIDASGSMGSVARQVEKAFNDQVKNIKQNAVSEGQETYVHVYDFSGAGDVRRLQHNAYHETVKLMSPGDFIPRGMTALEDATGTAIVDLKKVKGAADKNTSFLLVVITDGDENDSRLYKGKLRQMIEEVQKTDRWTIAGLVPPGHVKSLAAYGIPEGNITEWEATVKGTEAMSQKLSSSTSSYYKERASGQTQSSNFFTNAANITSKDLKKLQDANSLFKNWKVQAEVRIDDFVNGKLKSTSAYRPGSTFYKLTKTERIQGHKELVLRQRTTGKVYSGVQVRGLLGLPGGGEIKVVPGNHGDFDIFVESTSMNRKLVRGTEVLYRG